MSWSLQISGIPSRRSLLVLGVIVGVLIGVCSACVQQESAAIISSRVIVCAEKGDYDRAIAEFDQAIRLDPKNALAYSARGNAWDNKRSMTERLPTSTKRSSSIPSKLPPITIVPVHGSRGKSMT